MVHAKTFFLLFPSVKVPKRIQNRVFMSLNIELMRCEAPQKYRIDKFSFYGYKKIGKKRKPDNFNPHLHDILLLIVAILYFKILTEQQIDRLTTEMAVFVVEIIRLYGFSTARITLQMRFENVFCSLYQRRKKIIDFNFYLFP
jgi:hypothetical protein